MYNVFEILLQTQLLSYFTHLILYHEYFSCHTKNTIKSILNRSIICHCMDVPKCIYILLLLDILAVLFLLLERILLILLHIFLICIAQKELLNQRLGIFFKTQYTLTKCFPKRSHQFTCLLTVYRYVQLSVIVLI